MDRRENSIAGVSSTVAGKPLTPPQNAMGFLHDNCAAIAELKVRLKITADHIVGMRPTNEQPASQERVVTVLSRLEDQAFMLNDCFEELDRIERGLGVKGEGSGIQSAR